jgi:ribosome-associated translation inhibitor RaiA
MELTIRTRSIEITDSLRDLISRRLHFALDIFGDRIRHASVYLADVNGPRGGVDKSCQINVTVRGIGSILVSEKGSTSEAALTRATRV